MIPFLLFKLTSKRAFDTMDHTILINKLHLYGSRYTALDLIISYLNNRKKYINIHDPNSTLLDINCGVPQGSVF